MKQETMAPVKAYLNHNIKRLWPAFFGVIRRNKRSCTMVSGVMYDVDSYAEYLSQFLGSLPPIIRLPKVFALRNFLCIPATIPDCCAPPNAPTSWSVCDRNDSELCSHFSGLVEETFGVLAILMEVVSFDSRPGSSVGRDKGRILVSFDMMCAGDGRALRQFRLL